MYDDDRNNTNINRNGKVTKVTFKPLNVIPYCKQLFEQCDTTLIMSATILDFDTFCGNVGLDPSQVKFIEVGSDFPVENRPIYPLNIAYLNYNSLQIESVQRGLADAIDKLMYLHSNDKGIIHTTWSTQVRFIENFLTGKNRRRLIGPDPQIPRDEIISKHWDSSTSTENELILTTLHQYHQALKTKMVTFWTALPQAGLMIIVNGTFQHTGSTSNPTISINPTYRAYWHFGNCYR